MFPGSDDELEMGETGMGETGERVNYLDREEQGDSGEIIDYLDRAQMDTSDEDTDKGESNEESSEEEEEEDGDGGRTSTRHGGAGSSYGVLRPDRSRSRSRGRTQVRRGGGGRGGRGRRAAMRERPAQTDREWTNLGGPVDVLPFVREVGPTFTVPEDPTSIFLALFTTKLLNRVTAETNRCLDVFIGKSARGRVAIGMGDDCRRKESIPRHSRADGDPKVARPVRLLVHRQGPPLFRNCFPYLEETVPQPSPLPPPYGQ